MHPQVFTPPPTPERRSRRYVLIILAVVMAALVLVIGLPVGFVGIRYALFETGPYHTLPDVCATLTSPQVRDLLDGATTSDSSHIYDDANDITGDETNGCMVTWTGDSSATMAISVTYYYREWDRSSTTNAAQTYAIVARLNRTETPISFVAETPLDGAGDRGTCAASQPLGVSYHCVVLAGNAVVKMQFDLPGSSIESLLSGEKLTREELAQAGNLATAGYARPFARDVVAGLS